MIGFGALTFFGSGVAVDFGVADSVGVLVGGGEGVIIGGKLGIGLDSGISSGLTVISGTGVPVATDGVGVSLILLDAPRDRARGPGLIGRTGSKYRGGTSSRRVGG